MTRRRVLVGLNGANIMGSLLPALHADAFAAAGIDGYHQLMDVDRLSEKRVEQFACGLAVMEPMRRGV